MKLLFRRLPVVLVALTVSLVALGSVLGEARANHPTHDPKPGWYVAGGTNADRVLSKGGGVTSTWYYTKLYKDYTWRAYWIVRNVSSKPETVGCGGYKNYGLDGYKAKNYYHSTFNFEGQVQDAKCVHLGKDYTQTLQPGETYISWAYFKLAGQKGTCTMLTLPTGPKAPEHVGYTKCVDPYGYYMGSNLEDDGYRLPFVGKEAITNGPGCSDTHGSNPGSYQASKEAIDFGLKFEPVYAAKAGNIIFAGLHQQGFGNLIKIEHDNGDVSYYAHLDSFEKHSGARVEQGDLIATSGNTFSGGGRSTGPHLHFEVRDKNNQPVSIRNLPGITWDKGNPCQGVAIGGPV
jgi:hypothetical protein